AADALPGVLDDPVVGTKLGAGEGALVLPAPQLCVKALEGFGAGGLDLPPHDPRHARQYREQPGARQGSKPPELAAPAWPWLATARNRPRRSCRPRAASSPSGAPG